MRSQTTPNAGADSMWLQIDTPGDGYAGSIVSLVARIARKPSGRAILEGIRDSGGSVKIERPAPTDPPNARVSRDAPTQPSLSPSSGAKPDWYIGFDPRDWPSPVDPSARSPEVILFLLLRDALKRLRAKPAAAMPAAGEAESEDAAAIARFLEEQEAS